MAASNAASMASSLVMSRSRTSPPADSTVARSSSAPSLAHERSPVTTWHPCSRNPSVWARPMPLAPPVITMTLLLNAWALPPLRRVGVQRRYACSRRPTADLLQIAKHSVLKRH